jgi:hypothetical protein
MLFASFLFLAREAKIPNIDRIENIINPVFIEEINPGYVDGLIVCFPMYNAISIIAIPMLIICPTILIVPTTPEAIPRERFSTELMIAFEFGDEKSPKPIPIIRRSITIAQIGVAAFIKQRRINPAAVSPCR